MISLALFIVIAVCATFSISYSRWQLKLARYHQFLVPQFRHTHWFMLAFNGLLVALFFSSFMEGVQTVALQALAATLAVIIAGLSTHDRLQRHLAY